MTEILGCLALFMVIIFMPITARRKIYAIQRLGDPLGAFNEVHKVVSKTEIGYLFVASDKYTLHLNGSASVPIALGSNDYNYTSLASRMCMVPEGGLV